jgi:hypothetical protein
MRRHVARVMRAAWSPHLWCLTFAMESGLQAILDSLPPRRRSKLEPYAALIRALRSRGRSYREIVTILRDRCGLRVAMHTVYHFVRARAQKNDARHPPRRPPSGPGRRASEAGPSSSPLSPDRPEDVWTRIAAVKQRAPASAADEPEHDCRRYRLGSVATWTVTPKVRGESWSVASRSLLQGRGWRRYAGDSATRARALNA